MGNDSFDMCNADIEEQLINLSKELNVIYEDRQFVAAIVKDLDCLQYYSNPKRVLIFPPLNNTYRKVIHCVVKNKGFTSFSIYLLSRWDSKSVVVYNPHSTVGPRYRPHKMNESSELDCPDRSKGAIPKRSKKHPDAPHYVPPPQRRGVKVDTEFNLANNEKSSEKPCSSKQAVETSIPVTKSVKSLLPLSDIDSQLEVVDNNFENNDQSTEESAKVDDSKIVENITNESESKLIPNNNTCDKTSINDEKDCQTVQESMLPDIKEETHALSSISSLPISKNNSVNTNNIDVSDNNSELNKIVLDVNVSNLSNKEESFNSANISNSETLKNQEAVKQRNIINNAQSKGINPSLSTNDLGIKHYEINKISEETLVKSVINEKNEKVFMEEQEELHRACQNMNRKNKKIIKHVEKTSDVLIINEGNSSKFSEQNDDPTDWEDLLDETGELRDCYLKNIKKILGNCRVQTVKQEYGDYQKKELTHLLKDLEHVIELYDFPASFQTHDLVSVYNGFEDTGLLIKWVDDTHALLILNSPWQAKKALEIKHPMIKSRSLDLAAFGTLQSVKKWHKSLTLPAKRPPTCPEVAKRMVTGALGIRQKSSPESRQQERALIKNAKDKKKLIRQQQEDAWEGRTPQKNGEGI